MRVKLLVIGILMGVLASAPVRAGLVGSYSVQAGPYWPTSPPTYSCLEACALLFGGAAADYQCSTSGSSVNNLAWASDYGSDQHCALRFNSSSGTAVPETYKLCTTYS